MRLPLTVRWTDENVVGEADTESREVSSRGLYFHLPKGLRSGSPVEIVMTLPHELTQAGPVRVRCLGRVLRSSQENSGEMGEKRPGGLGPSAYPPAVNFALDPIYNVRRLTPAAHSSANRPPTSALS